ncbi:MAG: hypothetical protein ACI9FB_003990 [Candidatus Azotimanducaceae bacterium]|jgi:hypothetical protein
MENLSLHNRFLLSVLLPSLGVAILGAALLTSSSGPEIWLGCALMPTVIGIWIGLDSSSKAKNAINQAIDIVKKLLTIQA